MKKRKLVSALLLCSMAVFPSISLAQTTIGNGQTVTIGSDTNVTSNKTAANGGAVYVDGGTMYTTTGSKFENNTSNAPYSGGGAIYNTGGTVHIVDGIEFNNNYIDREYNELDSMSAGGAIASWNSGKVDIGEGVTFYHNGYAPDNETTSWTSGGAIYTDTNWQSQASLTIDSDVKFIDNAGGMAGALYMGGTKANIGDGAVFKDNSSSYGNGGAVYIYGGPGADEATQQRGSTVSFGTTTFETNSSGWKGGAVYNYAQAETSFGDKSQFIGNSAENNGGAIFNSGRVSADNYKATITATNATFSANHANGDGGAIYNTIDNLTSSTLTAENYQDNAVINVSGNFTNNSAGGMGGAIFNEGTANVSSATFSCNSAVNGGGALYNAATGSATLTDVKFEAGVASTGNDIINAGTVTTAGKNTFASNIRNDNEWHFTGENDVSGNMSGNGEATNAGIVNLSGDNSNYTGTYSHINSSAVTNVTGTFFNGESTINQGTLNWNTREAVPDNGALIISGNGTLNIGSQDPATGPVGSLILNEKSSIADTATININNGSSLVVDGGSANLNTGDSWNGGVKLNSGTLTIDNTNNIQNGTIQAKGGELNVTGSSLNVGTNSYIGNAVDLTVNNMSVTQGGIVTVNNGDNLNGITTLNGGTLNYGITDPDVSASLNAQNGHLNLLENSNLTIQNPSTIADAVVVDIQKGATLTSGTSTTLNLYGGNDDNSLNDKWNGTVVNDGGTINADNMVSSGTSVLIHTQRSNGVTNITNNSQILLDSDVSNVEGGTVNVKNNSTLGMLDASNMHICDLNVDSTSKFVSYDNGFDLNNLEHAGLLIGQNNALEDYNIRDTMNIGRDNDNQADFTIDVYGRSNAADEHGSDRFFADIIKNNSNGESAVVNISDWNLGGDIFGWDAPIDKHINLDQIFNYNTLDGNVEFNVTDKEVFSPIGWYKLNGAPNSPGGMTLDLTRFNPQVYRGQVTTIAQWMNQLAIDDMLFNHSMVLPSFKEEDGGMAYGGMMANRYAAIAPQFAPYQYSRKDGGLWYKMYGTFETLQMSQGLSNVGNNAYGTLIGADFGLKELKNGWKFMPTAYIGYNGAHQYYSGLGAYQNGGQAGFLGTWYKNNFIIGGLIYGGVYQNSMDIAGHTDNTFNYFAGAATKAAYNWRFHRDWVLQPNLFLAYNFFGQQNWHSDFGQMGMMSGILNGINLAPGLNLIWEKETFSIYATLQYMYNLNGAVGGRAGNVGLPHLYMDRGYIQYGIGFTKRFTDRFSGYFQTVFRNVGRTGVGFQLGFNWMLGK